MYRAIRPFELFEPTTIEEAVRTLFTYGNRAKVLAGGVDLVLKMRRRELAPEYVVSLKGISNLDVIEGDGGTGVSIGALATLRSLELSPIAREYQALWEGVSSISSIQIKNMGTVVGNLCAATPATDVAPPLFVFGANLKVVSVDGERVVPIEEFYITVDKTVLAPHEIVTEITVPAVPRGAGSAFLRVAKTGADIPKVNAAVMVAIDDGRCQDARIALGSVAPTVIRATRAEEILKGEKADESAILRAAEMASEEARPITDIRSTAEYRRTMVRVLVRDALEKAVARAKAS